MDSLRESIADEVMVAFDAYQITDKIIAAFEAALLSDEVVEAAAIEIHAEGWNGGEEWADVHPVTQDNYKQQARVALQAALAAAKGTEGSE